MKKWIIFVAASAIVFWDCGGCKIGTFACLDDPLKCIPQFQNCDGHDDCQDASDELDCDDSWEDKFWDHKFRKRPSAELEDDLKDYRTCFVIGFEHDWCTCQGFAVQCHSNKVIKFSSLSKRNAIQILDLSGAELSEVRDKDLTGFQRLNSLLLNHVGLEKIRENAFFSAENLTSLYLNSNKLKYLPNNWFSKQNILLKLHLGYNKISILKPTTFSNLSNLVELDLRNNSIETLNSEIFQTLTNLKLLYLNENQFTALDNLTFPELPQLLTLSLADNSIRWIQPLTFSPLSNLQELFLSGNKLSFLGQAVFRNLKKLQVLNLNNNNLEKFEQGVFNDTLNLRSLNLQHNEFKKLQKSILSPVQHLDYVYFDDFSLCSSALHVRVCEPKGDGISSLHHLLDSPLLRSSVWVMCVLACGGNILVLLGRFLVKEPNAVHSLYIKNLSLSDLLMGIYLFIIAAADWKYRGNYVMHEEEWRHSTVCLASGFLNTLSSESSVLILSLITWDRLISITKPLVNHQPNLRKAAAHLLLLWTAALIMAGAPLVGGPYFGPEFFTSNGVCLPLHIHDPYTQGWEYSAAMFIVLNSIALSFICSAYSQMLQVIKSSGMALRSTQERQDRVVAQRFAVIVATDCLCWIPVILIKILALIGMKIQEDLYAWLAIFILPINSALNPILYTLTTKLFKQQISRLLYACKQQTDPPGHGSAMSLSLGATPVAHRKILLRSRGTRSSFIHSQCSHVGTYAATAV